MGARKRLNVTLHVHWLYVYLNLEVFVLNEKLLSSSEIALCKFYCIHKPVDVVHSNPYNTHSPLPTVQSVV